MGLGEHFSSMLIRQLLAVEKTCLQYECEIASRDHDNAHQKQCSTKIMTRLYFGIPSLLIMARTFKIYHVQENQPNTAPLKRMRFL